MAGEPEFLGTLKVLTAAQRDELFKDLGPSNLGIFSVFSPSVYSLDDGLTAISKAITTSLGFRFDDGAVGLEYWRTIRAGLDVYSKTGEFKNLSRSNDDNEKLQGLVGLLAKNFRREELDDSQYENFMRCVQAPISEIQTQKILRDPERKSVRARVNAARPSGARAGAGAASGAASGTVGAGAGAGAGAGSSARPADPVDLIVSNIFPSSASFTLNGPAGTFLRTLINDRITELTSATKTKAAAVSEMIAELRAATPATPAKDFAKKIAYLRENQDAVNQVFSFARSAERAGIFNFLVEKNISRTDSWVAPDFAEILALPDFDKIKSALIGKVFVRDIPNAVDGSLVIISNLQDYFNHLVQAPTPNATSQALAVHYGNGAITNASPPAEQMQAIGELESDSTFKRVIAGLIQGLNGLAAAPYNLNQAALTEILAETENTADDLQKILLNKMVPGSAAPAFDWTPEQLVAARTIAGVGAGETNLGGLVAKFNTARIDLESFKSAITAENQSLMTFALTHDADEILVKYGFDPTIKTTGFVAAVAHALPTFSDNPASRIAFVQHLTGATHKAYFEAMKSPVVGAGAGAGAAAGAASGSTAPAGTAPSVDQVTARMALWAVLEDTAQSPAFSSGMFDRLKDLTDEVAIKAALTSPSPSEGAIHSAIFSGISLSGKTIPAFVSELSKAVEGIQGWTQPTKAQILALADSTQITQVVKARQACVGLGITAPSFNTDAYLQALSGVGATALDPKVIGAVNDLYLLTGLSPRPSDEGVNNLRRIHEFSEKGVTPELLQTLNTLASATPGGYGLEQAALKNILEASDADKPAVLLSRMFGNNFSTEQLDAAKAIAGIGTGETSVKALFDKFNAHKDPLAVLASFTEAKDVELLKFALQKDAGGNFLKSKKDILVEFGFPDNCENVDFTAHPLSAFTDDAAGRIRLVQELQANHTYFDLIAGETKAANDSVITARVALYSALSSVADATEKEALFKALRDKPGSGAEFEIALAGRMARAIYPDANYVNQHAGLAGILVEQLKAKTAADGTAADLPGKLKLFFGSSPAASAPGAPPAAAAPAPTPGIYQEVLAGVRAATSDVSSPLGSSTGESPYSDKPKLAREGVVNVRTNQVINPATDPRAQWLDRETLKQHVGNTGGKLTGAEVEGLVKAQLGLLAEANAAYLAKIAEITPLGTTPAVTVKHAHEAFLAKLCGVGVNDITPEFLKFVQDNYLVAPAASGAASGSSAGPATHLTDSLNNPAFLLQHLGPHVGEIQHAFYAMPAFDTKKITDQASLDTEAKALVEKVIAARVKALGVGSGAEGVIATALVERFAGEWITTAKALAAPDAVVKEREKFQREVKALESELAEAKKALETLEAATPQDASAVTTQKAEVAAKEAGLGAKQKELKAAEDSENLALAKPENQWAALSKYLVETAPEALDKDIFACAENHRICVKAGVTVENHHKTLLLDALDRDLIYDERHKPGNDDRSGSRYFWPDVVGVASGGPGTPMHPDTAEAERKLRDPANITKFDQTPDEQFNRGRFGSIQDAVGMVINQVKKAQPRWACKKESNGSDGETQDLKNLRMFITALFSFQIPREQFSELNDVYKKIIELAKGNASNNSVLVTSLQDFLATPEGSARLQSFAEEGERIGEYAKDHGLFFPAGEEYASIELTLAGAQKSVDEKENAKILSGPKETPVHVRDCQLEGGKKAGVAFSHQGSEYRVSKDFNRMELSGLNCLEDRKLTNRMGVDLRRQAGRVVETLSASSANAYKKVFEMILNSGCTLSGDLINNLEGRKATDPGHYALQEFVKAKEKEFAKNPMKLNELKLFQGEKVSLDKAVIGFAPTAPLPTVVSGGSPTPRSSPASGRSPPY